jgi:hypothetical protein
MATWSNALDTPVAAIVILLLALVTLIPVPAVIVAAAGAPAVDPIINCPSVAKAVTTGTPVALVVTTARLAVANPETTFVAEEYKICETVVVEGYVAVDQVGSAVVFVCNTCPVVPAPSWVKVAVPAPI